MSNSIEIRFIYSDNFSQPNILNSTAVPSVTILLGQMGIQGPPGPAGVSSQGVWIDVDGDFDIDLLEGETLDYLCFKNGSSMPITVAVQDGAIFFNETVTSIQTNLLLHTAETDEVINVLGILPGTKVKIKKS